MKTKVSPKDKGKNIPFGLYKQNENAITMIALIVMVIILVILTVVSLQILTDGKIIDVASDGVNDYNIIQYREQIENLRESIILKYETEGKEITLAKLASEMEKEGAWIKSAVANVSQDATNDDIIVTTDTNYVFQLYYNESYGKKFIEYIGRNTGKGTEWYPKLKASYEEGKITAKAMEKTSETIEKLELIYRGGLVDQREGNSPELNAEFNVTQTGWYILRATSSTGKLRYAWVRAANTLLAPKIEINTAGEQENGWYGKDNVPVTVKITAASESTKGIYYSLDRWASEEYVDRKNSHNRKYKQSRNNNSIRLCNR